MIDSGWLNSKYVDLSVTMTHFNKREIRDRGQHPFVYLEHR